MTFATRTAPTPWTAEEQASPRASSRPPEDPAAPATAVTGAERTIRKLTIGVCFGWFIAQALASVGPMASLPLAVVVTCLAANAAAVTYYAFSGRGWTLAVVLAATAVAIAVASGPVTTLSAAPVVMLWINQATTTTGFLWSGIRGGTIVLGVAAGVVGVFTWRQAALSGDIGPLIPLACSLLAIALADGWSAAAATGAMRTMARHSDEAARDLDEALATAAAAEAVEAEGRRLARMLHDNVINTLVAIRTLPELPIGVIRERCQFDLRQMDDRPAPPATDTKELMARLEQRSHLLSVTVAIHPQDPRPIPARVSVAVEGAAGEWLNNVAKHTPTRCADMEIREDALVIRDQGCGITLADLGDGGRLSILDRCAEAGVHVDLHHGDSGGTVAVFDWSAAVPERDAGPVTAVEEESLTPVMAQITLRLCLFMSIVGVSSTIVGFGNPGSAGDLAAMVLLAALIGWSWRLSRGLGRARWPWPVYFGFSLAVSALPGMGAEGCSRVGSWWWGPLAGLSASIATVLIDGRRIAIAAALAGYLVGDLWVIIDTARASGACAYDTSALLILDVGVVVAVIFFRRTIADTWRQLTQQRHRARLVNIEASARQSADRTRQTQSRRLLSVAQEVLEGIASGRMDPQDRVVREQCARTEIVLRSLIAIPPTGTLSQPLADLVVSTVPHGPPVQVSVDLPTSLTLDKRIVRDITETLSDASVGLESCEPLSIVVVTRGSELVVLCSGAVSRDWRPPEVGDRWRLNSSGGSLSLTGRWQAGP